MKKTKKIISIIPALEGGKGHMLSYHLALKDAAELNGWDHVAFYSSNPPVNIPAKNWFDVLDNGVLESRIHNFLNIKNYFLVLKSILILSFTINRALRDVLKDKVSSNIVFIERFSAFQLLAFVLSFLFVSRKRLVLWIMFRHEPSRSKFKRLINRSLVFFLRVVFDKKNLKILADSEPLAKVNSEFFNLPVHVLPIPHTGHLNKRVARKNPFISLWWPGSPRPEKGWPEIKRLCENASYLEGCEKVKLTLSNSAGICERDGSFEVELVDNVLSLKRYVDLFMESDVILLPYHSDFYRSSTSGIFVESVVAGAIPLVTEFTWMSYELFKYNLGELVVSDWSRPDLIKNITEINNSKIIKSKLKNMRKDYMKYHSIESFARVLSEIES